jgi:hypothetical protein
MQKLLHTPLRPGCVCQPVIERKVNIWSEVVHVANIEIYLRPQPQCYKSYILRLLAECLRHVSRRQAADLEMLPS